MTLSLGRQDKRVVRSRGFVAARWSDGAAAAMRLVAGRARVIAEGAAGCAVAAALSGRAGRGKIVAVVSGGNIDLAQFASLTL